MTDIEEALEEREQLGYFTNEGADILARAYHAQETKIKEKDRLLIKYVRDHSEDRISLNARIKKLERDLEIQINWSKEQYVNYEKCFNTLQYKISRIAALELALNRVLKDHKCTALTNCWKCQALSGSKLGELFQALLEEHKITAKILNSGIDLSEPHRKIEVLRKECGL